MRTIRSWTLTVLVILGSASSAHATKDCAELKAEIDAKLKAKGVQNYTLEVVPAAEVGDRKLVGSCEGGTQKIVYTRSS